jgi:hypothetical protein
MWDFSSTLIITIGSILVAPIFYIVRNFMQRVDKLETKLEDKMSREEVRLLLSDKLGPMEHNLEDIKESLAQLTSHILDLRK